MTVSVRTWEIGGVLAMATVLYFFLIRPWRREGHITTDGLFCLVFITLFWQDTGLNYFQLWSTYSSAFVNFGSWDANIVGWLSPNANLIPSPLIFSLPTYVYAVFFFAVIGCAVMRKAKKRWPQLSTFGLIMVTFGFWCAVDLILDPLYLLTGVYTYGGAIDWLTLFHGHYFQFPLYEIPMAGAWFTTWSCLRYFRNDKGETLGERGLSEVRVRGKRKTTLRFLALAGICNVGFLSYNLPASIFGLYADPFPKDITDRSYLMQGQMCGPGSTYACPGPGVPIPRPDSAHLSPDGKLVVPEGTKLPRETP
jgi:hypothetical protein